MKYQTFKIFISSIILSSVIAVNGNASCDDYDGHKKNSNSSPNRLQTSSSLETQTKEEEQRLRQERQKKIKDKLMNAVEQAFQRRDNDFFGSKLATFGDNKEKQQKKMDKLIKDELMSDKAFQRQDDDFFTGSRLITFGDNMEKEGWDGYLPSDVAKHLEKTVNKPEKGRELFDWLSIFLSLPVDRSSCRGRRCMVLATEGSQFFSLLQQDQILYKKATLS